MRALCVKEPQLWCISSIWNVFYDAQKHLTEKVQDVDSGRLFGQLPFVKTILV